MKSYRRCAAAVVLMAGIGGCQVNPDIQHRGAEYLQGVWVQDSVPMQGTLLQYTLPELTFTCDSVYATLRTVSKAKNIADSCYRNGRWTEYAKGVYVVRDDSLLVDGQYTRANGRQKISGCYRSGQYLPRFKIVRYSTDSLVLESRHDQRPLLLRKTADITCIPKKRWE